MRPLLLGEAPGRRGEGREPLSGAVGRRLAAWSGLGPVEAGVPDHAWRPLLEERFELANLLPGWPGHDGVGSAFPLAEARAAAERLRPSLAGRVVVLLGARLSRALHHDAPWRVWVTLPDGARLASVPHPSGLTRAYNDEGEREATGRLLREAIELAGSRR